jgi:hypothetical protein
VGASPSARFRAGEFPECCDPFVEEELLREASRRARVRLSECNRGELDSIGPTGAAPATAFPDSGFDLEAHVQGIEKNYIAEALKRREQSATRRRSLTRLACG